MADTPQDQGQTERDRMPLPERFEMWKRDAGKHLAGAERALFKRDMQDAADSIRLSRQGAEGRAVEKDDEGRPYQCGAFVSGDSRWECIRESDHMGEHDWRLRTEPQEREPDVWIAGESWYGLRCNDCGQPWTRSHERHGDSERIRLVAAPPAGEPAGEETLQGIRDSYAELPKAEWLKKAYEGKSLGETIPIDAGSTTPTGPTGEGE